MPIAAGNIIYASDLLMTSAQTSDTTARTTTSTSYTTALTPAQICGVAFTAPPSGKVTISWGCGLDNNTAPHLAVCSFAIRAGSVVGSGASFQASDDGRALATQLYHNSGRASEVTGLTPGTIYNVALEHRVASAGTGTFSNRTVLVTPELA